MIGCVRGCVSGCDRECRYASLASSNTLIVGCGDRVCSRVVRECVRGCGGSVLGCIRSVVRGLDNVSHVSNVSK